MTDFGELFQGPLAALGFGGVAGAVVGYTAKKVTKLVALILGGLFIVIQFLVYQGYLTVDWGAVEKSAQGIWSGPDGATLAERAWSILQTQLPFGAGFAAGFAIGFKVG